MSSTSDLASPSGHWRLLDPRRRAMLADMGVAVPWPGPVVPESATEVQRPRLARPAFAAPAPSPQASAPVMAPAPMAAPVVARAVPAPVSAPLERAERMEGQPVLVGEVVGGVAALDWRALESAAASCGACSLCATRQRVAFGAGPVPVPVAQAQWLVVGDAPGEHDDASGDSFSGPAGQVLDSVLRAASLSRSGQGVYAGRALAGAYLTHLIKCRPPGNRPPEADEVSRCLPYLERQIALLQPRIIVVVGRLTAQALLAPTVPDVQTRPLGQLRGVVHRYRGIPVIVSYPPSYLLRNPAEKAKAWVDWCLALETFDAVAPSLRTD